MRKRYDLVLISCCGPKLPHPAPAAELYTSQLFRESRAWAKRNGDSWAILSAEHGLVWPWETLEPYQRELRTLDDQRAFRTKVECGMHDWQQDWVRDHPMAMRAGVKCWGELPEVCILAGKKYTEPLRDCRGGLMLPACGWDEPLSGQMIGERLQWFKEERRPAQPETILCGSQLELF